MRASKTILRQVIRIVKRMMYYSIKFTEFLFYESKKVLKPYLKRLENWMNAFFDRVLCLIDKEYPSYAAYGYVDIKLDSEQLEDEQYKKELVDFVQRVYDFEQRVAGKVNVVREKVDQKIRIPIEQYATNKWIGVNAFSEFAKIRMLLFNQST